MMLWIALAVLPASVGLLFGKWKPGKVTLIATGLATIAGAILALVGAATNYQWAAQGSLISWGATAGLLGPQLFKNSLIAALIMTAALVVTFFAGLFIFGATVGCAWSGACL